MKIIEMVRWEPEAINEPEDNDVLVSSLVQDLHGTEPGQNAVSVCGDTLVFAAVDGDHQTCVYECTIRRVSKNLLDEERAAIPTGPINQTLLS